MPVIVSETCGCVADLVKNELNGVTFDPGNGKELESALQVFVKNPEKVPAMGKASEKLITPFSSKQVARQMAECYHNL